MLLHFPQEAVKEKPVVAEVINSEVQQLLAGKSLAEYNEGFLEQHGSDSLLYRAAAAEMMALLDPNSKAKAVQVILKRGGLVGEHPASGLPWHSFMWHHGPLLWGAPASKPTVVMADTRGGSCLH